jgi:hypothetical protein
MMWQLYVWQHRVLCGTACCVATPGVARQRPNICHREGRRYRWAALAYGVHAPHDLMLMLVLVSYATVKGAGEAGLEWEAGKQVGSDETDAPR